jgi:hypothetical protein
MRKRAFALAAALSLGLTAVVFGQGFLDKFYGDRSTVLGKSITALDTNEALLVKFAGANKFAKLAVDATTGDLTFTQDDTDGTTASTELECPVSGALGGIIDVSHADCDTLGEVLDVINKSASWRAVLLGALAADSSNNTLFTQAATQDVQKAEGLILKGESTVTFEVSIALTQFKSAADYFGGSSTPGLALVPFKNPFQDYQASLEFGTFTSTYGSGTSTIDVYSVVGTFKADRTYTEVATKVYSVAGGATTVAKVLKVFTDFGPYGVFAEKGAKLVVKLDNSAAMTSPSVVVSGREYEYR